MKLKFLLPLSLTTTLIAIAPILTSCNKNPTQEIKLDQIFKDHEDWISSPLVSVKKNETIHFSWNYSQLENWPEQPSSFMFFFGTYFLVEQFSYLPMFFNSCSMSVNNVPLLFAQTEEFTNLPNKSFTTVPLSSSGEFLGIYYICFRYDNLSQSDTVQLSYQSSRYLDEFFAISTKN